MILINIGHTFVHVHIQHAKRCQREDLRYGTTLLLVMASKKQHVRFVKQKYQEEDSRLNPSLPQTTRETFSNSSNEVF